MGFKAVFNTVIFVSVLGTLPRISGQVAELEIKALAAQMSVPNIYEFSIADYRRGWFSSEVDFRVDAPWLDTLSQGQLAAYTSNDITLHIIHGPLVYADKSVIFAAAVEKMKFRPEWSQTEEVNAVIGDQPLIRSTVITGFNGTISGTSRFPEIDYSDPDQNLSFKMSGYSGQFIVNTHTGYYGARGEMTNLSIHEGDTGFEIADVQFDMKGNKIADYIWGGEETLNVATITSKSFAINDMNIYLKLWDEGPVMHESMTGKSPFIRYGDVEITDGKIDFALRNIDKEVFSDYYAMVVESGIGQTENLEKLLANGGLKLATQFLNGSPEYLIREFSFTLPAGRLTSNMGVHFNGEGEINLSDQKDLLRRITSEGQASLPRTLALDLAKRILTLQFTSLGMEMTDEQLAQVAQQMLDGYVAQGLLVADGDGYRSAFNFEDGQMTLNGASLPLPM